ncbi:MAG: MFS transporter [Candidatus Lokiarchaeota archaeon]|nr:MFS transporter [Candidatus Lokiarchaeota archaeon]
MSELTTRRELHGKRLFGYTFGDLGFTLPNMFTGVFLFQYYVYTINLDAIFVAVGVTTQLIIGAISAIIFGVIIDNKKPGKYGKRRPFLLYGLPVWVITSVLIWFPQNCPQDNSLYLPTAIFFWVVTIVRSISRSLIFNVYLSMLPEQSQTLKNREKVAAFQSAFAIIASVIALLLPLIVQSFLENPRNVKWWEPSGQVIVFYIPLIGITFTIVGVVTVLLIYISVDESFHNNKSNEKIERITVTQAFARMAMPVKDRNYLKLTISSFFIGISGKIVGLLVFPFQTYVMHFESAEFYVYIFISIFGKFAWYLIWKKLLKRNHILSSYSICILIAVISSFFDIFFFFSGLPYGIKMALYIISWSTVLGSMYAYPLFSIPIMASLVHEAAVKIDKSNVDDAMSKISGSYYGLASFVRSMGPSFASLFVGIILSGANGENPFAITIVFISVGIFYLIAFFFVSRIRLSKDSYYSNQVKKKK